MATDYYMGNGVMMNYGETYEMKKEELIKVLDQHIDACMACSHYKDALKPTPNKKRSKVSLRKKLFKYYKRAKHGGAW